MKELSQIIEKLHLINQQIIEKDIAIERMNTVISLVSQMMTDTLLVKF